MLAALCSGVAQAQFSGSIKLHKKQHLVGEPVMVRVTLTNYTGEEQILHGNRMPWISFIVKTMNGKPVHARAPINPKPIRIGAGESLAKDFNLTRQFQLNQEGNYKVSAVIRPNDKSLDGTSTGREQFQLSSGRLYWKQKVGKAGASKSTREYRVIEFRGDKNTQLYIQIEDEDTGRILRTSSLGNVLMMRKPSMVVDREQHAHILFLSNPNTWFHYRISPDGEIKTSQMHRRTSVGDPKLTVFDNGEVRVTNSILFDPEFEAEQRAKIRSVTERP